MIRNGGGPETGRPHFLDRDTTGLSSVTRRRMNTASSESSFPMRRLILASLILAASSSAAAAASRNFTVTGFDKIRVQGPYAVTVRTGAGPSAKASGERDALDRMVVEVQGRTLIVRTDRGGWTGWLGGAQGGATLALTTHALTAAALDGPGSLSIDRMAAPRVDMSISGSGDVTIGAIETDRLTLNLAGSGQMKMAGKAAQARITIMGSGDVDAAGLAVADAEVSLAGSGDVQLSASRSARVNANGSGNVTITGKAACAVRNIGTGNVACGKKPAD